MSAIPAASSGPARPSASRTRAYEAFLASFDRPNIDGERVPLQIGFHFTLMNGGAYWRALERFAETVCRQAGGGLRQLRDYLDAAAAGRRGRPAGGVPIGG